MGKYEIWYLYYDVDGTGNVWRRDSGRFLTPQVDDRGYVHVYLQIGGVRYNMRVHRLVALKYLPNPGGYKEVNHKDGDKANNWVGNLEWCDRAQNASHAAVAGLMASGERHHRAKLSDGDVDAVRARIAVGEKYARIWLDYKDKISWWSFRDICRGKFRVKKK